MSVVKQRNFSLDFIRSLAAFCVVVNHSAEILFLQTNFSEAGLYTKVFFYMFFTFGRLGVPLFMLLTGYLLFSRVYTLDGTVRFYKKNLIPLIVTWEIWLFIYNIFIAYYDKTPFSFTEYLRSALFLNQLDLGHVWYMPMIIGVYLFLPMVSTVLHSLPKNWIFAISGILFLYEFLVPSSNWLLPLLSLPNVANQLDLSFGGAQYGLYFILGFIIAQYPHVVQNLKSHRRLCSVLVVLCLTAILFLFSMTIIAETVRESGIWYDFFSLPIISCLLFILLKEYPWKWGLSLANALSLCSFGIYLLHFPLLLIFYKMLGDNCRPILWTIPLAFITYCIAFLLVYCISKIPSCGQILFLKK